MCPSLVLSAAVASGLSGGLFAPPDEFAAFSGGGDVWTTIGQTRDGRAQVLVVGTAGDRVAFVVLATAPAAGKEFTSPVRTAAGASRAPNPGAARVRETVKAMLDLPGGGTVRLPLRAQLIEVADGKVRASPRRVTRAEIDAFKASRPDEYSLDALLRFVDARRKDTRK